MYLLFVILCLLLLLFNLEPVRGRPSHNHYSLIWTWNEYILLRILPQNWYVLIDKDILYLYMNTESIDTYIPAIQINTRRIHSILHYRYLLEWIHERPLVQAYPPHMKDVLDILNYMRR